MSDPNYQDVQYGSKVMVGCGCRNLKDVVTFIRERRIDYVELAWADEMGLWYNEIVPVSELTYANLQEGVPCKDGRFLIPDPLSARIAPLTQPTAMMFTCKPPINRSSHLKTKHLSPGWIDMISKKIMENDRRPSSMDRILNGADLLDESNGSPRSSSGGLTRSGSIGVPRSPSYGIPGVTGTSAPSSPSGSPVGSPGTPQYGSPPGTLQRGSPPGTVQRGSPPGTLKHGSLGALHYGSPGMGSHQESPNANTGFIEWKVVRNESFGSPPPTLVFPPSPISSDGSPTTPPGSVPGSPSLPRSPRSPVTPPDSGQEREDIPENKGKYFPQLPPLLRPRQIHPTKANKLGITKPVKKRRNTEHLYCRHCGTTETPEWRRGPDGRKSLCNACGLYFSKMIKRETMVIPQGRRVAIDALLNPHS